jgi:YVTN family beta-propeller protein
MKVNYHLNRSKRLSRLVVFFFIVCTIVLIGIPLYTSISSLVRKAWADSVIATIPVGDAPTGIAFNANNSNMYVAHREGNFGSGIVSVIDGQTNTVVAIPIRGIGFHPFGIAFNPNNGDMYVASSRSDIVSVIDGQTNTVIAGIQVGNEPYGIAFNPNNGYLYVTNRHSGTVSVIDGQNNTVIGNPIPVGAGAMGLAFNPNNGDIYVANNVGTVSVIDGQTNTVTGRPIPAGDAPTEIAFNANNGDMYVTNFVVGTVTILDGRTNTANGTLIGFNGPNGIAFNANNGDMYVANNGGTVSIIDGQTNTVVGNPIPVGAQPFGIAFNANNGNMYVTNAEAGTVSVIQTSTFTDTTITSAIDGNNNRITGDGTGSTVSNRITFTFNSTVPSSTFECSIDASAFSGCTSPKTYQKIATGGHTFRVRAMGDPTPATFTWKTLTPSQGIQKLIDTINNLDISMGAKTSLNVRLKNAIEFLIDNNPENDEAVCGSLDAFLAQVNSKEANKQLTLSQAADLRQQAIALKNSLGCALKPIPENHEPVEPLPELTK